MLLVPLEFPRTTSRSDTDKLGWIKRVVDYDGTLVQRSTVLNVQVVSYVHFAALPGQLYLRRNMLGGEGFGLQLPDAESGVLPLDASHIQNKWQEGCQRLAMLSGDLFPLFV